MPHKKTPILPQIKLKYSERKRRPGMPGINCCLCKKKNVKVGSVMDAYSKSPKYICEECAIFNYQIDNNISSLKAAAARRRRIFDVTYLFTEMFTDLYMEQFGHASHDDLDHDDFNDILEASQDLYNYLYDKDEKIRLEETVSQKEIAWEFDQALKGLD